MSNLSPTHAVFKKTPHEAWFDVKPRVSHLKVFGCVAFTHIPIQNLKKLDDGAVKGIFIGYSTDAKAYRIYIPATGKVIISRDVKFVETEVWQWIEMQN